jgi:predicted phosphoadenosine phosphosulfate sulfurtransferase
VQGKIEKYLSSWRSRGYKDGVPDEAPARLEDVCKAPSYRAICRAILRNDVACVSLGFGRPKTPEYMAIKKVELDERLRRSQAKD